MTQRRPLAVSLLATALALAGCISRAPSNGARADRDGVRQAESRTSPASGLNTIAMVDGRVVNRMPVFGRRDWISLGCTLFRVSERPYEARDEDPSRSTATSDAAEQVVHEFRFSPDTQLRVRFRSEATGSINGTIGLVRLKTGDGSLRALPTAVDFVVRMNGQTVTLALDRSSPFNSLEATEGGSGFLSLALAVDSKSDGLAGSLHLGETYFFRLPVMVDPEFRTLRFRLEPSMPAHLYTPVSEITLDAADGAAPRASQSRS